MTLPLTGERTVPGIAEENYWFRRHEAAYLHLIGHCADGVVLGGDPLEGGDKVVQALRARFGERLTIMGSFFFAFVPDVLDTEITPELVPTGEDEEVQSSEAKVGPYSLQDFTLFHVLRYGFAPSKIAFLAWHAWHDPEAGEWPPNYPDDRRVAFDLATIRKWLDVFVRRFFASQFKRSALPNGPKVSAGGTMSPRGDWRMPSDASPVAWLAELEANVPTS